MRLAVEASGIVVRFGPHEAISRSSLAIPAGGRTAVIGPNGSGKSTLLSLIAGLIPLDDGSIRVLGTTPTAAREQVAYVLQSAKVNEMLPVTVREVVAMGRYAALGAFGRFGRDDREAVDAALERLDLGALSDRHLGELSGGQRQRVFVAQGLVQEHSLLLLDEPMTGLDIVSRAAIEDALDVERSDGCTVVVTTHDLDDAFAADHVVLMAGRVVAHGPPEEVLTATHLSHAYRATLFAAGEPLVIDDSAHRPVDPGHHIHLTRGPGTHEH
jgi:iron complex transport system ATP-binding protein